MSQLGCWTVGAVWAVGSMCLCARGGAPTLETQPSCPQICNDVGACATYVYESALYLRQGAPAEKVLGTLSCIASCSQDTFYAQGAVRAIFHLANDDEVRRGFLTALIEAPDANELAKELACELLVYVADAKARELLRRRVAASWPSSQGGPEYTALVELADVPFVVWIEARIRESNLDPNSALGRQLQQFRAVQSETQLVASIRSADEPLDRAWAVRQGLRAGFAREKIGGAVLDYLQTATTRGLHNQDYVLLAVCDEAGLFTGSDAGKIPAIAATKAHRGSIPDEGVLPPWVRSTIEERRREFYRPTKPQDRVEPTVPTDEDK